MTRYETPGYYRVTDTPDELPSAGDCVEGRVFVTHDRLVCGAGEMGGMGYADALDDYSESTVRRLFGSRLDPQELDFDTALGRDGTVAVRLSDVASAELRRWDGSRLRGAEHTFAVCIHVPSALEDPLLLQLGRGGRNRGTGRTRHASLARWVDALADGAASTPESEATDTESTPTTEAAGFAGTTDVDESTAADSTQSDPETGPAIDPGETPSDAGSATPAPPGRDSADTESDTSVTQSPDAADASADRAGASGGVNQSDGTDSFRDESEAAPRADPPDAEPDPDEIAPEPTWLDTEPDAPALIVKNRSDIRLRPRIRCRHENEVLFLDDVDLAPEDTRRWPEFPEEGVVHLDILFDDGSRKAEHLDERHLRSPPVGIDLYASGVEVHAEE